MKQMHILDQMTPGEVAELKAQSATKTFQRREIIFHKEDTPKYLYVLLEGAVCVFDDTPDGTRNILTIIREPMDCFAEVYLFIDERLPFSAEAMKKSTVLMIPRSVLHQFPQISQNLNVLLSQKAYTLSQLASYLGVSRPALSRELYRMVDEGLLVLDEHGNFKTVI